MNDLYLWSAIVGCTFLLVQFVLQILGLGDGEGPAVDADTSTDALPDASDPAHGTAGNIFFGLLSLKALVAFVGIFGLTGLSLEEDSVSPFLRLGLATLAGVVAMFAVAWMMRALNALGSSGTVVLSNALGQEASTYLTIPASGTGRGKVTIELQGRTMELPAVTDGPAIPTGARVRVVALLPPETLKVERA